MRLITAAFGLLVAIITVSFSVSNRQFVTVSLWPTPFELTLPLVVLIVFIGASFFLLGWILSWLRSVYSKIIIKKENKAIKKRLETAENKIKELETKLNSLPEEKTKAAKTSSVFFG